MKLTFTGTEQELEMWKRVNGFRLQGSFSYPGHFVDVHNSFEHEQVEFIVEDLPRWRAVLDGTYWYVVVDAAGQPFRVKMDTRSTNDDVRWRTGNYFKTETEARVVAERIADMLKETP